jgi:hypothetical protein
MKRLSEEEKKERRKIANKKYSEQNKEKIREYHKEYSKLNSKKAVERSAEYTKQNKEKVAEYKKIYREQNKEKIREYHKEYSKENKDRLNESKRAYDKVRIKNDPLFKLKKNLRTRIWFALKQNKYKKYSSTIEIIGCSFEELREYIESKFEPWMSWDNYGLFNSELNYGWDIDHIIPLAIAKNEEGLLKLNHFNNLQPLCSYTNRVIKKHHQI